MLSLAGEKAMLGAGGDLEVEPFLPDGDIDAAAASLARDRAMAMPMLRDRLFSENGDMLVLLVPLQDPNDSEAAVEAVLALVDDGLPQGLTAHVAGVATMNAKLAAMVSGDTRIFVPAAVVTVLLILWVALRRPSALAGPLAVIAGGRRRGARSHGLEAAFEAMVRAITGAAVARPALMLGASAVVLLALGVGATAARFDYQRKNYFAEGAAVRDADAMLNARLGGINFLDVSVTAAEEGGLMTPQALGALASLRADMTALPHVGRVSGIDEHLAYMHGVLTGAAPGALPTRERAPAQYMFLYEASGEPDDFHREISADHTAALLRAQLDTDRFSDTEPVVEDLQTMVDDWSRKNGLEAVVSGRVAVNDGWMSRLAEKHFQGLGLACLLVFLASWAAFRSLRSGALAMAPVLVGVLFVYAAMGFLNIDIAPATSMTAAIATGLGVDFAIHLISHIRVRQNEGATIAQALDAEYRRIAVACIWCAVSLAVALMVVCLSSAPPLRWFGALVAAGAMGSLVGSLVLIPALMALRQPHSKQGEPANA